MTDERAGAPTDADGGPAGPSAVRHEEDATVRTERVEAGGVSVRKQVATRPIRRDVERAVEEAGTERVPALEDDAGQVITYDDGSISIPVFEEQLVIEKRLVVRERVVVRKHTVTEEHRVETTLRREEVEIDVDPSIAGRVHEGPHGHA